MTRKRFKLDTSSEQENFLFEIMTLYDNVKKMQYDKREEVPVDKALILMTRHDRIHQISRSIDPYERSKKGSNRDIPRTAHDTLVYLMEEILAMEDTRERDFSDTEVVTLFWDKVHGKKVEGHSFVTRINEKEKNVVASR